MANRTKPSRRELLRALARWAIAPAITGGIGTMSRRTGEDCINDTICRTCGLAESCVLPQALSFRDTTARKEGDE